MKSVPSPNSKPHVLRYWESQFRFLSPAKNRSGNRVYKARELELIMLVKHLLYTEKFTIEGARIRLDQYRKSGDLKTTGKQAMRYETVGDVRRALDDVLAVLDGKEPVMRLPAEKRWWQRWWCSSAPKRRLPRRSSRQGRCWCGMRGRRGMRVVRSS